MKSNIKIFTVFLVLMTACVLLPGQTEAQQSNVSFQIFYDQLSPYGQWVDYSDYGYVWIPDSGSDFVPYSTDGHWILTKYGWTWASDYIWGWATFHYGRWSFDDYFGWFWVPDNEWGPAWVNWRQADGYYGWSPMEPGISINMSFGRPYDSNYDHWLFVRDRDFERSDLHNYYVNQYDHDRIVRNSTVINLTYIDNDRNTTYVSGPSRDAVQRATGRTIRPLTIYENNKPGQQINNGQLRIYRPQIEKNNSGRNAVPTRVTNLKDVKRAPVTNTINQNRIGTSGNRPATQPVNTVNPQNNNAQQRNVNQQNINNQGQQNRTITPANQNRNNQPILTPADNTRPVRQPNVVNPQNNNVQPVQQRNVVNPQNNNVPSVQQRNANQQNNVQPVQQRNVINPQNNNVQPVQQRNINQQNNAQPVQQRNVVNPQNSNVPSVQQRNANQQNNAQPIQQQNVVNPQNNNVPSVQQRNANQQNNNPQQRNPSLGNSDRTNQQIPAQPVQQREVNPSNNAQPAQQRVISQPNNNTPARQQKSIKQQVKKEQDKVPDTQPEKK